MSCRQRILCFAVTFLAVGVAHSEDAPRAGSASAPVVAAGKTGKERLGDKASDEQRVDNCHVPHERRGSKPRPDACAHDGANAALTR